MYFESVQVKKTTLDETFAKMIDHTEKEDEEDFDALISSTVTSRFSLTSEIQAYAQTKKVTRCQSLGALLKTDFAWSNLWRQMGMVILVSLLTIGAETIFCLIFVNISQPTLNYNNVEAIFEENSPPILAFANTYLPDGTTSTEPLTSLYLETLNEEAEQVMLN